MRFPARAPDRPAASGCQIGGSGAAQRYRSRPVQVTSSKTKGRVAIFLAAVLIATLVFVGVSSGLGHPGVPSGDVAIVDGVDDGVVTQEQLDSALIQAAVQGGLKKPPPADDPQYQALLDQAMQSRLFVIWVRAEAADRGITVDDEEIDAELDRIKEQNFASAKEFDKYVEQSKLTDEDIRAQIESDLLQQELSKRVVPSNPDPAAPAFTQAELAAEVRRRRRCDPELLRRQPRRLRGHGEPRRPGDPQQLPGEGRSGEEGARGRRLRRELGRGGGEVLPGSGLQGPRRPARGTRRGLGRPAARGAGLLGDRG